MPAERGDMPQHGILLQGLHNLRPRDERPQRHTAPESLGQAHDVGRNAVFEHGEQRARASHAGLYFVEDQQGADVVGAPAQRLQVPRQRRPDAGLALHGFGQHTRRAARDALQGPEIVEFDCLHVGQQGPKSPFPLLALGRSHHAHRAVGRAVVGAAHGNQFRAPGMPFGEFERPLDRFGARVDEVYAFQPSRQQRGDFRSVFHLRGFD